MTDIHTCSYECDRPACIKAQRDELRVKVEAAEARVRELEADAVRYRWLRDRIAPEELTDETVALFALRTVGPIANRPADDDCLEEVDAAIDAAREAE